jgi:serine/threonine-protein kinase
MAPEKLSGQAQAADEVRCDIYSLGVTLFEAVTLHHPIPVPQGLSRSYLPAFLTVVPPRRPRALCPTLPPALEAILLRAMHRDPDRRYPDAVALANDLERFLRQLRSVAIEPARKPWETRGSLLRGDSPQPIATPHVQENAVAARWAQAPRYVLYPKGLSNKGM